MAVPPGIGRAARVADFEVSLVVDLCHRSVRLVMAAGTCVGRFELHLGARAARRVVRAVRAAVIHGGLRLLGNGALDRSESRLDDFQ